jgi:hypothetical protein
LILQDPADPKTTSIFDDRSDLDPPGHACWDLGDVGEEGEYGGASADPRNEILDHALTC